VGGGCGGRAIDQREGCVYAGRDYAVGASFPSNDGCNTCSCTSGGSVECTKAACGCESGGQFYAVGQTFSPDNGCNTCTCALNGVITSCTHRTCLEGGPPPNCTYNGSVYPEYASFPAIDGCNTCTCAGAAGVVCTDVACFDAGPPACSYNGYVYWIGDHFPAADGCGSCTCTDAGVACPAAPCGSVEAGTPTFDAGNDVTTSDGGTGVCPACDGDAGDCDAAACGD
jgi:hypothetical protein